MTQRAVRRASIKILHTGALNRPLSEFHWTCTPVGLFEDVPFNVHNLSIDLHRRWHWAWACLMKSSLCPSNPSWGHINWTSAPLIYFCRSWPREHISLVWIICLLCCFSPSHLLQHCFLSPPSSLWTYAHWRASWPCQTRLVNYSVWRATLKQSAFSQDGAWQATKFISSMTVQKKKE